MLKQFLVTFTTFLVIDGVWLTLIAKEFYAKHLGFLMAKTPNLLAAMIFYLIYVLTMVILIISPALKKGFSTNCNFNWSFVWTVCICDLRFN